MLAGRQFFSLTGTIHVLGTGSITVRIYDGHRFVKPTVGQVLAVQATAYARYQQWAPGGYLPISCDGIADC